MSFFKYYIYLSFLGVCPFVVYASNYIPEKADPFPVQQTSINLAKKLASEINGTAVKVANTGSMVPTIVASDLLVYRPVKPEEIKVGDIIVFSGIIDGMDSMHRSLFTHRVVKIDYAHRFWTKGDAYQEMDKYPVKNSELVGIIVYIIHGQTNEVEIIK